MSSEILFFITGEIQVPDPCLVFVKVLTMKVSSSCRHDKAFILNLE
jgi:hypothetical protein